MGQQPQVVMHINQGFFPVYIQVVSLYTMDEAIASPTPLYRRGLNHLRNHLHCKFMQMCDRGAIHVPPLNRAQHVSIFGCMQVTKDSIFTDVFAHFASYMSTLLFIRYQLAQCKNISIFHLWICVWFSPNPTPRCWLGMLSPILGITKEIMSRVPQVLDMEY
jgi:hypothetical protein